MFSCYVYTFCCNFWQITGHVSSAINPENISLLEGLLDTEGFDSIIEKLGDAYDAEVLFNFFLSVRLSAVCAMYHR